MIAIMAIVSALLALTGSGRAAVRGDLFVEGNNVRVLVTGLFLFGWAFCIPILGFFVAGVTAITLMAFCLARARRRIPLSALPGWVS